MDGCRAEKTYVLHWDGWRHCPAQEWAYMAHPFPALLRLVLPLDQGADEDSTRNVRCTLWKDSFEPEHERLLILILWLFTFYCNTDNVCFIGFDITC